MHAFVKIAISLAAILLVGNFDKIITKIKQIKDEEGSCDDEKTK